MTTKSTQANKLRLTKKAFENLTAERASDGPRRYWDTELRGFYLQFTPAGVASYCVRYIKPAGGKGDFTVGRADLIAPERAREAARERLAELVINGADPVQARLAARKTAVAEKEETFAAVARRFIAVGKEQRSTDNPFADEWALEHYAIPAIGKVPIHLVTVQMVEGLVKSVHATVQKRNAGIQGRNGRTTANLVHAATRRVFAWEIKSKSGAEIRLTHNNPAEFKRLFQAKPEKRIGRLNEERFGLVWREVEKKARNTRAGAPLALQLYMLTLQRPIDIARAERADFNFEKHEWRIPPERTKTDKAYFIPLSPWVTTKVREAFAATESKYLFPGNARRRSIHLSPRAMAASMKSALATLVAGGAFPRRTISPYDFRRFGRTQIRKKLKFEKEVAERVINHADENDMSNLYDMEDYEPSVREAQLAWSQEVWRMVYGEAIEPDAT